eukprot:TRINITY_DN1621_c1_g1_i1.p1 TRINITY_DN1621_c1_g1~~TRINITY_DN1621_c1_g1_i1.p1  ORF type:complete len:650 (-),score=203.48 TRINITY_DN1621_c1_g1_i1:320-2269(-)
MVGVSAAQLGSTRLTGGRTTKRNLSQTKLITADELLVNGPRGGPGSYQTLRYNDLSASQKRLSAAAAVADDRPEDLFNCIKKEEAAGAAPSVLAQVRGRLGGVVLDRVRRQFICTSMTKSTSKMRSERLHNFQQEVVKARPRLEGRDSPAKVTDQFRLLEADAEALEAVERAKQLKQEAISLGAALGEAGMIDEDTDDDYGYNPATPSVASSPAMSRLQSPAHLMAPPSPLRNRFASAGSMGSVVLETSDADMLLMEKRGKLLGEALRMLTKWKAHGEVALLLCVALTTMAEKCGSAFRQEMDRRGLGSLASTLADMWSQRPEVCRTAMRLLATISVSGVLDMIEEQHDNAVVVCMGLDVLNKKAKDDPFALDQMAAHGGREVVAMLEEEWCKDRTIDLHAVNLKRRLRRSKVKSQRKQREVNLPPDDVIRIRGCWESIDEDGRGYITARQLGVAMQMLGMKMTDEELEEAVDEVDVNGTGQLEWPEFLWLMFKVGASTSIEHQFTDQRLAELREVFSLFDADGNGSLDAKELGTVMRVLGLHMEVKEIQAMIASVDADNSGAIDWPEFLFLMSKKVVAADNQHRLAFEYFDKQQRGRIFKSDFIKQMKRLTNEFTSAELEEMTVQAKFEDDDYGSITYKEFVKMMMRG